MKITDKSEKGIARLFYFKGFTFVFEGNLVSANGYDSNIPNFLANADDR